MKNQIKLEKAGYTIIFTTTGNVIAKKNQRSYRAESIDQLCYIIFGE